MAVNGTTFTLIMLVKQKEIEKEKSTSKTKIDTVEL